MKKLWVNTKDSVSPDLRHIYVDRIWDRIGKMEQRFGINGFSNIDIVVNDREYGNFGNLMDTFSDNIEKTELRFACTIHGDEHAKNIMIYNDAITRSPTGWVIIDYVNVMKEADWIFSIAKMLQWWEFYCVLEQAKQDNKLQQILRANLELRDRRLIITYDKNALQGQVSTLCRDLQQMVLTLAQETADAFEEDEQVWHQRLELALFSVIFGSAPLHFGKADFAVPIMIGESLKHLQKGLS